MPANHHARWAQAHNYRPLETTAEKQAWKVAALTGATMLVEIVAGYAFNSMALLADGWHMASHMLAIGLTALAYFLARRYAHDPSFAFGTWKVEVLAGFTSSVMLLLVVALLAFESFWRLLKPQVITFDMALWVAIGGLLINIASAWMLREQHDHSHAHADDTHDHPHNHNHAEAAKPSKDLNRQAAFVHVLADALTSVAAILALLGGWMFGWYWLDAAIGIVGSMIIGIWAKGLLIETGKVLLDREMDDPVVERVRNILAQQGDTEVADLHVWRVGQVQFACIVALVTHGESSADQYKERLAEIKELVHVTVEVNRCTQACGE